MEIACYDGINYMSALKFPSYGKSFPYYGNMLPQ